MDPNEILAKGAAELSEITFPRVLHALSRSHATAVLELVRGEVVKKIVFEDGVPVDCRSNLVHETLSRFLVQQGKLTREEETRLLGEAAERGMLFGEVLRDNGLVTADEVYRLLQQNLAKKLLDPFTWKEGRFRILEDLSGVESALKVKVPQLILTGCSRFVSRPEIELEMGQLVGQRLARHPRPPVELGELHLSDFQCQLLASFEEPRTLSELTGETTASFEDTTRFVYALLVLELVLLESELASLPAPPAAPGLEPEAATEHTAGAEPPSPPPIDAAAVASEVMGAYLRHRRVDPWGLLGVPREASEAELRRALLDHCRRFAPWSFESGDIASLRDKVEELFFAGVRAYSLATKREAPAAQPRPAPPPPPPAPSPTPPAGVALRVSRLTADELAFEDALLDPEDLYRKGLRYLKQGHLPRALQAFDTASSYDPQNSLYRAEAAHLLYQVSPSTATGQAREELETALRIDPNCGLAHYYYGLMLRDLRKVQAAKDSLRKAARLMKSDPRPVEALRELTGTS